MPCPCHAPTMPFSKPQHGRRETACGLPALVRLLPATTPSSTKVVIRRIQISDAGGQCETKHRSSWTRKRVVAAHYEKDDLLHCWTNSSDISSYCADFHEGHGNIGAWHGSGMASVNQTRPRCVNQMGKTHSKPLAARHGRGTAWVRHRHGILCVNRP